MPNKNTLNQIKKTFQLILKNNTDIFVSCSKKDIWNFVCDMEINELSNQNDFYYPYEEQYAQEESYKELTMNQKENR